MRSGIKAVALALLLAASNAFAQDDGSNARIMLQDGDVLNARLVDDSGDEILIAHPTLGEIAIPRDRVTEIVMLVDEAPASAPPDEAAPDEPAAEEEPAPELPEKSPWTGSINFGINGQEGNTEEMNVNFRAEATREREADTLRLAFTYLYGTDDGDTTDNKAELFGRNDWKFSESRWSWFLESKGEYDQFEDWNFRVSVFTGPAYRFIETDRTKLTGSIGAGFTQEFGGDDDGSIEGLLGLDFSHAINDRVSLTALARYFPNVSEGFSEFRAVGEAGLTVNLNEDGSFILTVGLRDEFDSDPGDAEENDLYYFLTLGYAF